MGLCHFRHSVFGLSHTSTTTALFLIGQIQNNNYFWGCGAGISREFRKMYDVDGLAIEDFTNFGGTLRTLRGFLQSVNDLESFVRDVTVPNPDK